MIFRIIRIKVKKLEYQNSLNPVNWLMYVNQTEIKKCLYPTFIST